MKFNFQSEDAITLLCSELEVLSELTVEEEQLISGGQFPTGSIEALEDVFEKARREREKILAIQTQGNTTLSAFNEKPKI